MLDRGFLREIVPLAYQSLDDSDIAKLGTTRAQCEEKIILRSSRGTFGGERAFFEILRQRGGWQWLWRIAIVNKPMSWTTSALYGVVSRNRQPLSAVLRRLGILDQNYCDRLKSKAIQH